MIKYFLFPVLIVSLKTWIVAGIFECCPEENNVIFLSNSSCGYNNLNITKINLNCSIKIPFSEEEWNKWEYNTLLENGTMLDDDMKVAEYCHALHGDHEFDSTSPVYIICYQASQSDWFTEQKQKVHSFLMCISVAFVICTIIVYFMVPSLLDLQGICIMHALTGLSLAFIFLSINQLVTMYDTTICKTVAYIIYFSFFYMFFWLVVLSFDIWRITVKPHLSERTLNWPIRYHMFAIGGTVIFLIFILLAHYSPSRIFENIRPGFGEHSCWFEAKSLTWIYFYGPILVLLLINILLYVSTVVSLWPKVNSTRNKILKYRVKLCLRLCVIMGITWTIEIFSSLFDNGSASITSQVIMFILDSINSLQGVLIFLILIVFRKRVRRALASKNLCNIKFPNSWKYLEDEEMESAEEKANGAALCYRKNEDLVDYEIGS